MRYIKLFLSLLFLFPVALFSQVREPSIVKSREAVSSYQVVTEFYNKKAWSVFNRSYTTYRDKYNAASFYSYPRIFWADIIPDYAPYDKAGALFIESLKNTYESLKIRKNFDYPQMAVAAFQQVVLTPRTSNPLRETALPQPGDVWYSSLRLASFYEQLTDYIVYIQNNRKEYQEYLSRLQAKDTWSLQGYADRDFSVFEDNIKETLFQQRQLQIGRFVSAYTDLANSFVRSTLIPLQTQSIEGGDVRGYLKSNVNQLPAGLSKEAFIERLMLGMPSVEDFYEQAAYIDPSFKTQIQATYKIFTPLPKRITTDDFFNALSLFEYVSVGTLVDRLDEYGKVPTRQEALDRIVSRLAAGALNKQLASVADGLYEYEKPFYYSYGFSSTVSQKIVKNWYLTARESHTVGNIEKIAADNILQSGRRAYQDDQLVKAGNKRKMVVHAQAYRDALPMVTDFVAGEAVYQMAAMWPLAKNFKGAWQKLFKKELVKAFDSASDVVRPTRSALGLEKVDELARVQKANLGKTRYAKLVTRADGIESAVWRLTDEQGNVLGYLKYGSNQEFANTQKLNQIIKQTNILDELKLIDVEYPVLLSDSMSDLPVFVNMRVADDYEDLFINVRAAHVRMQKPFVISEVDLRGVVPLDLYTQKVSVETFVETFLGGKRITDAEWDEIIKFYRTLNENGLVHEDTFHNTYLFRQPNGKLKMSVLDFEPLYQKAYPNADMDHFVTYRKDYPEIFAK